jgi:hypothetical protein
MRTLPNTMKTKHAVGNAQNYWIFLRFPPSGILENTTFQKLDLFPSSGKEGKTPTQLGTLERANLNHWTIPVRYTQLPPFPL